MAGMKTLPHVDIMSMYFFVCGRFVHAHRRNKTAVKIKHFEPTNFDFGKKKAFPMRPGHFFASCEKAMTDLDWAPEYNTVDGLRDSYENDFVHKKVGWWFDVGEKPLILFRWIGLKESKNPADFLSTQCEDLEHAHPLRLMWYYLERKIVFCLIVVLHGLSWNTGTCM